MIRATWGEGEGAAARGHAPGGLAGHGPHVRRLIELPLTARAAARHGLTPERFVLANIGQVKGMAGNPYGDDDEAIAVGLMRGIAFWGMLVTLGDAVAAMEMERRP